MKQIHVLAHAVDQVVGLQGVAGCQSEAVVGQDIEPDPDQAVLELVHAYAARVSSGKRSSQRRNTR